MKYFLKIFKESIIIVIISSLMGLFSGTLLSFNEDLLKYTVPVMLLILPALNSLIGDISTVLVSRLTTHLYIGTIQPKVQSSKRLKEDFYGLLITLILSLGALIFLGYLFSMILGITIVNPLVISLIICITVLLIFTIMFLLSFISAIVLFKRGMDPNNFLIPFITSLADFLTPFFLILFIIILI